MLEAQLRGRGSVDHAQGSAFDSWHCQRIQKKKKNFLKWGSQGVRLTAEFLGIKIIGTAYQECKKAIKNSISRKVSSAVK